MGKVELQLIEKSTLKIFPSETYPSSQAPLHMTTFEKEVAKVEMDFPEDSRRLVSNPNPDTLMDEMYKFPLHMQLPRSLRDCRQNVNNERIKIDHIWRLKVNLHNPEGHVSQLICKIPIKLFISPNLPINDNQDICPGPNQLADAVINQQETTLVAPPEYGAHHLDQLYNDIDPSGFMTPHVGFMSASGANTPFYSHSRAGSSENLASITQAVEHNANGGGVSASAVHSRLSNLQDQNPRSWVRSPGSHSRSHTPGGSGSGNDYFTYSQGHSTRHSPPSNQSLSRRISEEHADSDTANLVIRDLSRVPSYNTAVHTPRPENPADTSLPTYEVATSRPPTPELQRPGQAHVRNGHGSGSLLQSMTRAEESPELRADIGLNASGRRSPVPPLAHHRSSLSRSDEEARLRFLRANMN